jgi:hypothetical protein
MELNEMLKQLEKIREATKKRAKEISKLEELKRKTEESLQKKKK